MAALALAASPAWGAASVVTEAASAVTSTGATLNGTVNPDGTPLTECVFEWGPEKNVQDAVQTYLDTAPCVPGPGGIGTGTTPVAVQAVLGGLQPGTRYAVRLKAANADGTIVGNPVLVQTAGPAIAATWAESVTRTEAALKAQINPEGEATTYRFEYGTSTAYGSGTPELAVGSDSSGHVVVRFLAGLQPGTTYHYRVIATNGTAQSVSADHAFTTLEPSAPGAACPNQAYRFGPGADLPDCRAYELVSPLDKNGSDASEFANERFETVGATQAAIDGSGITFTAANAFGDAVSAPLLSQYISTRGDNGWSTHSLNAPKIGPDLGNITSQGVGPYKHFSPDLRTSWLVHFSDPLVPGAPSGVADLYRRDPDGSYLPLTLSTPSNELWDPDFQGFSADESHVVFALNDAITDEAPALGNVPQLYEWFNGDVRLVSVLPNGEPAMFRSALGGPLDIGIAQDAHITGAKHAISDDGSTIFWTLFPGGGQGGTIYARLNGTETIPVSGTVTSSLSHFWAASADGSAAVFQVINGAQAGDLYEFDVATETPTLIAHGSSGVLGAADDLSYLYFTSREALDAGATAGAPNLYVRHGGAVTFVATLSRLDADEGSGHSVSGTINPYPSHQDAQVSADGHQAVFTSDRSLTGYDNVDADLQKPATEVYRYDAVTEELACISCNPSGARPKNSFDEQGSIASIHVWVDAWVPGARKQTYARRIMSADGSRVFFNSRSPLAPGDTNGAMDVYQWEEQGSGTCNKPEGCISLISTGTSPRGAKFLDASASGDDVFFVTYASIDPRDPGLVDIYDARVNGGLVSLAPADPCVGDSCQAAPSAPSDPTPTSASFRGAGDLTPHGSSCGSAQTRAAKLARRAGRLDGQADRSSSPARTTRLRQRAMALRREAKKLHKRSARCRQSQRKVAR